MERLFDLLAQELERRKRLPAQVARHLDSAYGVSRDEVGDFFEKELEGVEDYEVDLILSPVFTPTLADQALFAPILGENSLQPEQITALIQRLVARPTIARLMTEDGRVHPAKLREVSVARYVQRLRLEGGIPAPLDKLITTAVPEARRALTLAVARRAVWEIPSRAELLSRYIDRSTRAGEFHEQDVTTLLRLAETYGPAGVPEFVARMPGWIEAVRREANAAMNPKPFFNERVEELHGGGRDQRRGVDPGVAEREAEMETFLRLQRLLGD